MTEVTATRTDPDILVVDDNPINLDLLCRMLSKRGYRVRVATNGSRALAAARAECPDLIMLDINMPDMQGYEVCKTLKSEDGTRGVPVIFISALDDVIDKVKAFNAGGVDYVTKPFEFAEVLARIENQLQISRLQHDLERRNLELQRVNEELLQAHKREKGMFKTISDLLPGTELDGRYQLESTIGTGGFGTVFRATQINLDRPVAVKILQAFAGSATPEDLTRFRREGISACRVNHPNAVTIYDAGVSPEGIAYLVMELLTGHSLGDELTRIGPLQPMRVAEILAPVCRVLAVAHAVGIVHRDIKPLNIFIHESDGAEVVKVLDFGVAKLVADSNGDESLTGVNQVVGTIAYMAPERIAGRPSAGSADVFSVGVTAYQALTGELPYGSGLSDLYELAVRGRATPLSIRDRLVDVRPDVESAIIAALHPDPEKRPTPNELADALESGIEG